MKVASTRLPISFVVFALSSVVNPAYLAGCFSITYDESPQFGEKEMLRSLDHANDKGTWRFSSDDVMYEVDLALMQKTGTDSFASRAPGAAPLFARAYACGNRTFYQSASACVTVSELALEGTLTLRRLDANGSATVLLSDVDVDGTLMVYGDRLDRTEIYLQFGNNTLAVDSTDAAAYSIRSFTAQDVGADAVDIAFAE